ncbi:MAG: ribosomal RNA small subunit methyltransferase A [Candidatus Hydrogenedentes bacterium]|nr:ribosomal RNA small subunit methyltransferase A [Candidatus Hydrogenedentota bacterium]
MESSQQPHGLSLREMCKKYDIRFKRALGQNLLLDDNINRIMVDAAQLDRDDAVIEVGAGLGALTRRISTKAGYLLSIEIDASFIPCLEEQFGHMEQVRLFRGDVLNHSLAKLIEEYLPAKPAYKMVSNLPYYITTPLLFHFLEAPVRFSHLVVMMQEEVGERLVAPVNAENYGILSVAARCYAKVDLVHKVPASCFMPKPKVDSCIVRFRTHDTPMSGGVEPAFLMKVVRAAFATRRKTLRNCLTKSGNFGVPKEQVLEAMDQAGIDGGRRPQTLSIEEFATLAGSIRERIGSPS